MKPLFTIQINPDAPSVHKRLLYRAFKRLDLVRWYHPTQKEFERGKPLIFHEARAVLELADIFEDVYREFVGDL